MPGSRQSCTSAQTSTTSNTSPPTTRSFSVQTDEVHMGFGSSRLCSQREACHYKAWLPKPSKGNLGERIQATKRSRRVQMSRRFTVQPFSSSTVSFALFWSIPPTYLKSYRVTTFRVQCPAGGQQQQERRKLGFTTVSVNRPRNNCKLPPTQYSNHHSYHFTSFSVQS